MPILLGRVDTGSLLTRIAQQPKEAGLLLDVDGTLSPIVARPEAASVPEPTRDVLRALRDRYALVACVSGRTRDDAARLVGIDGIVYLGEHGLDTDGRADEWAPAIAAFADSVAWPAERKRVTVSFHYRTADDEDAAVAELHRVAEQAIAAGLRPRWGRKVLEVRPPVDADKGTAVHDLLRKRGLQRALYAGDDSTDLDAFRGLDGLDVAVRVAVVSDEGPSELGTAADVVVGGTEALVELLRRLL
ncbi:MAG TPA: trehalose-phosphatase [Gaiellaceae bacterium]|nr:trehalose-phosphatase [Gaiellaceae bacterium]